MLENIRGVHTPSCTPLRKSSPVTGFLIFFLSTLQATNYVLEHQEADSQGELETKLIKVRMKFELVLSLQYAYIEFFLMWLETFKDIFFPLFRVIFTRQRAGDAASNSPTLKR